jgi:hypothetical protein
MAGIEALARIFEFMIDPHVGEQSFAQTVMSKIRRSRFVPDREIRAARNTIIANGSVIRTHHKASAGPSAHSESASNLLIGNGSNFADFSE